jgi:Fusaric acid resistance protein-like
MRLMTFILAEMAFVSRCLRSRPLSSVLIARLLQMPETYCAAIATLVVMQSTLGATLTLSIGRIVATAVG